MTDEPGSNEADGKKQFGSMGADCLLQRSEAAFVTRKAIQSGFCENRKSGSQEPLWRLLHRSLGAPVPKLQALQALIAAGITQKEIRAWLPRAKFQTLSRQLLQWISPKMSITAALVTIGTASHCCDTMATGLANTANSLVFELPLSSQRELGFPFPLH